MREPYQPHSATSKAAADSAGVRAPSQRERVLRAIQMVGRLGATDEEIQIALNINPSTQRPRRIELMDDGLVRDSGTTRRTRSGRRAVVWVAVGSGKQMRLL